MAVATEAITVRQLSKTYATRDGTVTALDRHLRHRGGRVRRGGRPLGVRDKAGVKRWGENSEANDAAYADFMLKYGIIKDRISGGGKGLQVTGTP
ncbi:MAG TPA: hypothetical protein VGL14_22845 [Methylomirabilota bacterium]|jgi:hypothetical protein